MPRARGGVLPALDPIGRLLLRPARESVDRLAMAITAVALPVVALLLVYPALSFGRRSVGPDGGDA